MTERLRYDKRVLVTQAEDFMGPVTVDVFREEGAAVIADSRPLETAAACRALIAECGRLDVLESFDPEVVRMVQIDG